MSSPTYSVHTADDTGLDKSSVLVTGEREALLVDGQFTLAEQHRILGDVIDSGKELTTVVVTTADPDYYFGLEVIRQAFPEVRIVAPPPPWSGSREVGRASSRPGHTWART
ncbi:MULTISPECIES: hypothetical protein [Streptomyces]|uniref:hypothetical protein n=1 Tax=Streptomyces TaxID=1883 RepID=UPI00030544D8|nr:MULTISPECIES: hypothetical protein [Streptomyces]